MGPGTHVRQGSVARRNGLSTPVVIDTDGDRVADRVYAGDIHGNLWAFDFSSKLMSEWKVANATPLCNGANRYTLGSGTDDADEVGVKAI